MKTWKFEVKFFSFDIFQVFIIQFSLVAVFYFPGLRLQIIYRSIRYF